MLNPIADDVDTKIRYATEVAARSLKTLCRCKTVSDDTGGTSPIVPAGFDYIVFGDISGPEVNQAVRYLQSLGLKASGVDADTVPDECRTFDLAFLPVVLDVRTGGLFISNPATSRKGFDAWRMEL